MKALRRIPQFIMAFLPVLLSARPAMACAVCFGAPDSAMTQGAKAGILILLGVTATVLAGIVAVALFWMQRARMLEAQEGPAEGQRAHA